MSEKHELLLEIGCEEIPTSFILPALERMEKEFVEFCKQNRIAHGEIKTYATPRRLTLIAADVDSAQEDKVTEVKGPPAKAAVDAAGKFTAAAAKFAESRGGKTNMLEVRDTDKGQYVFLTIKEKGAKTAAVLPGLPAWIVGRLQFPKNMRWDVRRTTFARPVRWIMLLYGDKAVKAGFDGIPSGAFTYGNRWFGGKKIAVKSSADYFEKLEAAGVIVDHNRRREMIREGVAKLATGKPHITETLLNDVTFLVEYPYLAVGSYPEEYTKLPKEVIIICIEKNQHYFPIEAPDGSKMLPIFIVVMNVPLTDSEKVISGYEKVLNSRLKDAVFFYDEDLRKPFRERVESLGRITFQEKLGSILDKTKRVQALVETLGKGMNIGAADVDVAKEAAWLMKADLTTQMVFEYTEIQGTVGKHYALHDGVNSAVAQAIEEHYMPRFADDDLPASVPGALLAVADKMDTIVGYFSVGLIPTGSADPYQLRRAALGVIRILEAKAFDTSVSGVVSSTLENYKKFGIINDEQYANLYGQLMRFFSDRVENYFRSEGFDYDIIRAAMMGLESRTQLKLRNILGILKEVRDEKEFQDLLEVYMRISNILKNAQGSGELVRAELFENDEEKKLNEKYDEVHNCLSVESDVKKQIEKYYEITPFINMFFEKVLVNAENQDVRKNRVQLLMNIKQGYDRIVDFSGIVKKS